MKLSTLHLADFQAIKRHIPFVGCHACIATLRRHFTALIICSATGLDITFASPCQRAQNNITRIFHTQAVRDGLFDRLHDARVLAPDVDWMAIKRGKFASEGYYYRAAPLKRTLARYSSLMEEELRQRRRALAEVCGGAGDGFGFRSARIGELDGLTRVGRRLVQARSRAGHGGGADALSAVGDDRYVEHVNAIARGVESGCLELAEKDRDHQARLDAWLAQHARRSSRVAAVPLSWTAPKRWTVHGVAAQLIGEGDDEQLDIDGERFDVRDLHAIPMDRTTMKLVGKLPRMSVPAPF